MEQLYRLVKASELPVKILEPLFVVTPDGDKAIGMRLDDRMWYDGKKRTWMVNHNFYDAEVEYYLEPIEESEQEEAKKYVKEILKTTWTAETFFKILSSKYHLIKK